MALLDKLERRFSFIAIPGLPKILVAFTALVFGLAYLTPDFIPALTLDRGRILHGEVWRLFTYIFIPSTLSPFWVLFALWFLWWVGEGLERAMGPFRLTLYFLLGMIGTTTAAFFFNSDFSNGMLMASLFFAFARFYADEVIYVLFILPMKIKWVAWVMAALLLVRFFGGPMSYRMAMVAALANYLIFFGREIIHDARNRRDVSTRRRRFDEDARSESEPLHKCKTCGATELSDLNLEFRVARDGEEYCIPHLPQTL